MLLAPAEDVAGLGWPDHTGEGTAQRTLSSDISLLPEVARVTYQQQS